MEWLADLESGISSLWNAREATRGDLHGPREDGGWLGALADAFTGPSPARRENAAAVFATRLAQTSFASWQDIVACFKGKTEAEVRAIKEAYEQQTGMSFDDRFGADYTRWEQTEIDGESCTAAVDALLKAEGVASYDQDAILDAVRGKSALELAEMRQQFKIRTGQDMDAWI